MIEEWRTIEDYPNYMVSNLGNVKSINYNRTGTERLLKTSIDKDGYLSVILCNNVGKKGFRVHRLVAQSFIPNPENLPIINHKNQIVNDNRVENLEWCNYKYNNNYADRNVKVGIASKKRMLGRFGIENNASKSIIQFTKNGDFVKKWYCITDAERELNINHQDISKCCKFKQKTAGGFIWKYKYVYDIEQIYKRRMKKVA